MSDLKNGLQHFLDGLKGLEERARKLKNQNLADIAASAHNRVKQLCGHPDLELVDEKKDQQAYPDGTLKDDGRLNPDGTLKTAGAEFDPNAPTTKDQAVDRARAEGAGDPYAAARTRWPHLFEPAQPQSQQPYPQARPQQF